MFFENQDVLELKVSVAVSFAMDVFETLGDIFK